MTFVEGFVAAVPTAKKEEYVEHAKRAAVVFKDHGAIRVAECWSEDVPEGDLTSFSKAVKRREEESVVFSWVEWSSRDARDAGMVKVFQDPRMQEGENPMPFDGKRLIYGGFQMILES